MRGYNYRLQPKLRIMTDEITGGSDILGALLMGHAYNAWWTGSDLTIEESRRLVPHQNATTVQVAISAVAAVLWMIANPRRGVCLPDHLPHEFILENRPSLPGQEPLDPGRLDAAAARQPCLSRLARGPAYDFDDPWQFKNFLVDEAT